jgi:hypothetical protein
MKAGSREVSDPVTATQSEPVRLRRGDRLPVLSARSVNLEHMSEETALKLKDAEAVLSALEGEVHEQKKVFLSAVAVHLPQRVDEFAKKTAHSEPDVTKALGTEGVRAMRNELEGLANQLAKDIASATSSIEWPAPTSYEPIRFKHFHSALFNYMYPKMNRLAQVFKRNGFDVHDSNRQNSQGLVLPQWFYTESDLTAETKVLSEGLSRLERAKLDVQAAREADDASTVADLWGD